MVVMVVVCLRGGGGGMGGALMKDLDANPLPLHSSKQIFSLDFCFSLIQ